MVSCAAFAGKHSTLSNQELIPAHLPGFQPWAEGLILVLCPVYDPSAPARLGTARRTGYTNPPDRVTPHRNRVQPAGPGITRQTGYSPPERAQLAGLSAHGAHIGQSVSGRIRDFHRQITADSSGDCYRIIGLFKKKASAKYVSG